MRWMYVSPRVSRLKSLIRVWCFVCDISRVSPLSRLALAGRGRGLWRARARTHKHAQISEPQTSQLSVMSRGVQRQRKILDTREERLFSFLRASHVAHTHTYTETYTVHDRLSTAIRTSPCVYCVDCCVRKYDILKQRFR